MVSINTHEARILAGMLAYPSEDSLETLELMTAEVDWLGDTLPELQAMNLDAWQGEHTRLFINGIPKTPCLPFASVWLHGAMQGQASVEINGIYQQAGLEPNTGMPDFLGTLLEAIAYLSAPGNLPDEQRILLLDRLWGSYFITWVPKFSKALIEEGELKFYRELGKRLLNLCEGSEDG